MSRSNPNEHLSNPTTRWFEWDSEHARVKYYDKEAKANIEAPQPFTFMLLEELATIRGYSNAAQKGIFANEVRDTTLEPFVVKVHKGETIAEGLYRDIKADVKAAGGKYTCSCYIAYKDGGTYRLGNLQLKGASLTPWLDFRKKAGNARYTQAITINGHTEGKTGRVTYTMPVFELVNVSPQADKAALELDKELQAFLTVYLKRAKRDQAETSDNSDADDTAPEVEPVTEEIIPF